MPPAFNNFSDAVLQAGSITQKEKLGFLGATSRVVTYGTLTYAAWNWYEHPLNRKIQAMLLNGLWHQRKEDKQTALLPRSVWLVCRQILLGEALQYLAIEKLDLSVVSVFGNVSGACFCTLGTLRTAALDSTGSVKVFRALLCLSFLSNLQVSQLHCALVSSRYTP